MMNRRQLMCMGGAALFAHVPKARAATTALWLKKKFFFARLDPISQLR